MPIQKLVGEESVFYQICCVLRLFGEVAARDGPFYRVSGERNFLVAFS